MTMAGFRLTQVKQALKAYARTGQAENFFEVESFAPSRLEAAALYEELLERSLIDPGAVSHEHYLTEAGLAIAGGKTRRSPLSTAHRVQDDLLARIEQMNEHSAPLNVVQRVWLFGSVMRGQETIGDIDLAIETARIQRLVTMRPVRHDFASWLIRRRITSCISENSTGTRSEASLANADMHSWPALTSVRTSSSDWACPAS
jgi:predicted nucleotidyltransferase